MFLLIPLKKEYTETFITDMQKSFQLSAQEEFGDSNMEILDDSDMEILPRRDVEESLSQKNSFAYQAMEDGKLVGGAIVHIDHESRRNHLEFLYVKHDCQNRGIGQKIWNTLETLYPETRIWETVTPYFDKRNLHFYINQCGFCAVEFYHPGHRDKNSPGGEDEEDYSFRFKKHMHCNRNE